MIIFVDKWLRKFALEDHIWRSFIQMFLCWNFAKFWSCLLFLFVISAQKLSETFNLNLAFLRQIKLEKIC